jgi:opacity protein-like surface antigen
MSSATRAACALVLASLVATATAAAQGARTQFGAGASLTFPIGDFHADANGDGFKLGWQGIALLDVQPRGSPVGFRVDGTYGENSSNDKFNADLSAIVGAPTTAKVKQLGGTANVVYHFKRSSGGVAGYLISGIGVYNVKLAITSGNTTADSSETKFVWNFGAGLTYALGGAALFFEARYVDVSKSFGAAKTTFIPFTAGVRFGGK